MEIMKMLQTYQASLGLSLEEISALEKTCENLYSSRLASEEKLRTVTRTGDGEWFIEIPSYPEEGTKLLSDFRNAVRAELGNDRGDRLMIGIEQRIVMDNASLGTGAQQVLVDTSTNGMYKIVHKIAIEGGTTKTIGSYISPQSPGDYQWILDSLSGSKH
jgi:hypothetical protein